MHLSDENNVFAVTNNFMIKRYNLVGITETVLIVTTP